jgi:hypothetical protein
LNHSCPRERATSDGWLHSVVSVLLRWICEAELLGGSLLF